MSRLALGEFEPLGKVKSVDFKTKTEKCDDWMWLCSKCSKLLGYVDKKTKSNVRIKYQDLYIYCENADVFEMICRGCGYKNQLERVTPETKTIARVGQQ